MVQRIDNLYPGINAHFNSRLQQSGGWPEFHTIHIGDIAKTLKAALLPLGYTVGVERSLQIWHGNETSYPRADVAVFDPLPVRPERLAPAADAASALAIPELLGLDPDEPFIPALVVSRRDDAEPVAWLELVSPSNKPPGSGFIAYEDKRKAVLRAGLVYVELDYLHQQPPTFRTLRDYTRGEADSQPYRVVVIDPRPTFETGKVYLHEFGVDDPLPVITLPLSADDRVNFDLGQAYRKTFEEGLYGAGMDYSLPPAAFETFLERDRLRILARMAQAVQS